MLLEKDGEYHIDNRVKNTRNITWSQGRKEGLI